MNENAASSRNPELERCIARLLTELRESKGVSQAALAIELGHDQSFVSRLENGQRRVTAAELLEWAAALDISFSDLAHELAAIWKEHVETPSIWKRERP